MSARTRRKPALPLPTTKEDDIEAQLSLVQSMLKSTRQSEERVMRAEKRHLRYDIILRPLTQQLSFTDTTVGGLRRHKQNLFNDKKHPPKRDGTRGMHVCRTHGLDACEFVHVRTGDRIVDPREPSFSCEATGMVYVCISSLVAHCCGADRCRRYIVGTQGNLSCEITGLYFGTQFSRAPNRWVRPGTCNDDGIGGDVAGDVDTKIDNEIGGGGGGGDDDTDDLFTALTLPGDEEVEVEGTFADVADRKRKELNTADGSNKRRAVAASATDTTRVVIVTERERTLASFEATYRGAQLPEALTRPSRFAPGSSAEKMRQRSGDGKLLSATPYYGNDLIRYSFDQMSPANKRNSEQLCEALLFHRAATKLFDDAHARALARAERDTDAYTERCKREGRLPNPFVIMQKYLRWHEPLIAPSLARAICSLDSSDLFARQYFAQAVLRLWKMIEVTPYCCELNMRYGGASAKKRRSHTHLKKIAPALYYCLAKGLATTVHYNPKTRAVYTPEQPKKLLLSVPADELVSERIEFMPAHQYLAHRLPQPSQLSKLDFSGVTGNGEVDLSIITNMRFIAYCFRSLLSVEPPLAVETVRQYQLRNHLQFMDESPYDGGSFVRIVEEASE